MAAVPTISNVSTALKPLPGVQVKGFTSPDTFGASFGENIVQAGQQLETKIAPAIVEHSQIRARDALLQMQKDLDDLQTEYSQFKGKDALDNQDKFNKRREEIYSKHKESLGGNMFAVDYFEPRAKSAVDRDTVQSDRYVLGEMTKYDDTVNGATINQGASKAAKALADGDTEGFNFYRSMTKDAIRSNAKRMGISGTVAESEAIRKMDETVAFDSFEHRFSADPVSAIQYGKELITSGKITDPELKLKILSKDKAVRTETNITGVASEAIKVAISSTPDEDNAKIIARQKVNEQVVSGKLTYEEGEKAYSQAKEQLGLMYKSKAEAIDGARNQVLKGALEILSVDTQGDPARMAQQRKMYEEYKLRNVASLPIEEQKKFDDVIEYISSKRPADPKLVQEIYSLPDEKIVNLEISSYDQVRMGKEAYDLIKDRQKRILSGQASRTEHSEINHLVDEIMVDLYNTKGGKSYRTIMGDSKDRGNETERNTAMRIRNTIVARLTADKRDPKITNIYDNKDGYVKIANDLYSDPSELKFNLSAPYNRSNSNEASLNFNPKEKGFDDSVMVLRKWSQEEMIGYQNVKGEPQFIANSPYSRAMTMLASQSGKSFDFTAQQRERMRLREANPTASHSAIEDAMINGLYLDAKSYKPPKVERQVRKLTIEDEFLLMRMGATPFN